MRWEILHKYIDGSCSKQELRYLGEWLQESQANEDFFKTFIEHFSQEKDGNFEGNAHDSWARFKNEHISAANMGIVKKRHVKKYERFNKSNNNRRSQLFWYAVSSAALMLIAMLFFVVQNQIFTSIEAKKEIVKADIIDTQKVITAKGERTSIRLNDGTLVTLNSESELNIPGNYGQQSRILHLKGEAFFDVTHNEERIFLVVTPQGFVKDLGTQFNVQAYDSSKIEVAVKEGMASLGVVRDDSAHKELIKLSPNELGVLEQTGNYEVSKVSKMSLFTGWVEGKLVFIKTPLPKVLERLERWYDIKCRIEDPQLTTRTLTATYEKMPLEEVLEVLSASVGASYERKKGEIIFQVKQV